MCLNRYTIACIAHDMEHKVNSSSQFWSGMRKQFFGVFMIAPYGLNGDPGDIINISYGYMLVYLGLPVMVYLSLCWWNLFSWALSRTSIQIIITWFVYIFHYDHCRYYQSQYKEFWLTKILTAVIIWKSCLKQAINRYLFTWRKHIDPCGEEEIVL